MYSVCPVQGMQTALQVLFTTRKKGIISGMGNEPCALWKGIGSAGQGLFSLKAAMDILSFCTSEISYGGCSQGKGYRMLRYKNTSAHSLHTAKQNGVWMLVGAKEPSGL